MTVTRIDPAQGEDFRFFCGMAKESATEPGGAAGLLFELRVFLGRVFGKACMALITHFRVWVVHLALMRAVAADWERYPARAR